MGRGLACADIEFDSLESTIGQPHVVLKATKAAFHKKQIHFVPSGLAFVTPGFLKNKTRLIICVPRKSTHMSE
jgi:hypothetical protein